MGRACRDARSAFEPPRAGVTRYGWNLWYAVRRRTWRWFPTFRAVVPPLTFSSVQVVVMLVPTYAWFALGRRRAARWVVAVWVAAAVVAVVGIGLSVAGWAMGVMVGLHAVGVAEYFCLHSILSRWRFWLTRFPAVLGFTAIAYGWAAPRICSLVVIPVRSEHGLLLINSARRGSELQRGELVAFQRERWYFAGFLVREGVHLGRVVGLPGDVISFQAKEFRVNGQAQPRQTSMPREGELRVPVQHRFIWMPAFTREFEREDAATRFAAEVALVPDGKIVGRPYEQWFLRRQSR